MSVLKRQNDVRRMHRVAGMRDHVRSCSTLILRPAHIHSRPNVKGGTLSDSYIISRVIRATPKRLFEAWLDSREHSDITGLVAIVDPAVGGIINVLDGLIAGTNIQVEPYHRIVQVWEVASTDVASFESHVEIVLSTLMGEGAIANAHDDGTTITVTHSKLSTGQSLFSPEWWEQTYFGGMDKYFSRNRNGFMHPAHQREAK